MKLWNSFMGIGKMTVTSAYPAGTLQAISNSGVSLYHIQQTGDFCVSFQSDRSNIAQIRKICAKRGDQLDIDGLIGIFYYFISLLRRPVFVIGIALWLIFALWLSGRILFVLVAGNHTIPSQYIMEQAADCGIGFGAERVEVRSESVKNELLSRIPQLQWAGINTNGCVATVSVQEKTNTPTDEKTQFIFDLIAKTDSIITDITVTQGTAMCQIGQAVKRGETLISSYRDNGIFLEYVGAKGEVYGNTKHVIQAVAMRQGMKRARIIRQEEKISVIIGKKQINFYNDSGILDTTCVKIYDIKELTLPGGYVLPIKIVTQYITYYDTVPCTLPEDSFEWMADYTDTYLKSTMVAGQIQNRDLQHQVDEETYQLMGQYDCHEMIGNYNTEEKWSQNGEDG